MKNGPQKKNKNNETHTDVDLQSNLEFSIDKGERHLTSYMYRVRSTLQDPAGDLGTTPDDCHPSILDQKYWPAGAHL